MFKFCRFLEKKFERIHTLHEKGRGAPRAVSVDLDVFMVFKTMFSPTG